MTGKRRLAMLAGVVGISTGAMAQQSVRRDALPAVTQQQPALVQQQVPPMPAILMLLRSTVIAVTQSNASGSYENLRALGTTAFRNANSNERLSQVFEPLRRLGYDLSPVLVTAPEVSEPPMVMANGMLRIVGVFPTRPVEVPFAVMLAQEDGRWKVNDLNVGARPPQQEVAQSNAAQVAPAKSAGGSVPAAKKSFEKK